MDARDVIVAPRITEKAMADALSQQYTFVVHPHATKTQIRHAIEEIFKVNVLHVNTLNVRGKSRNFARRGRRTTGRQSDYKKAIVTIKPGQKIELGGVNYFEQ
ncbi:MAG: 50S ribosomal protein L23 [Candidatus Eremiobacteraeota bacterium]|nr:50S ribosomal protein L23 [Candidatus Eremiobacteraeota bacterium]MBV8499362.1 50S ribosomal protein L23 [Candidatus Eremiobacteraeota bacterium]